MALLYWLPTWIIAAMMLPAYRSTPAASRTIPGTVSKDRLTDKDAI
jgi:hypothetical protein